MNEQSMTSERGRKKLWRKPEVVSLNVDETLGGRFIPVSESIVFTAPGQPAQRGTS